jgi:hypothetical protein
VRGLAEIIPLRTSECRDASDAISQIAAAEEPDVDPRAAAHVRACLRCQAEVAAYRRVLRAMRAMSADGSPPTAERVAEVLSAVDQHNWAVRAAYVGGITVATAAAGAAGVLVWMSRRRFAATG